MTEGKRKQQTKGKRWGVRIFWAVNIVGAIILIPLMIEVAPLVGVWWNTLNEENYARSLENSDSSSSQANGSVNIADENHSNDPSITGLTGQNVDSNQSPGERSESLQQLDGKLQKVEHLDSDELDRIVAVQFGKKVQAESKSDEFHEESAVFHTITKSQEIIEGKTYHCYHIDLVDQNGNHRKQIDCFEAINLDYERSMQTMELVNSNPHLKRIYDAAAHIFGQQSSEPSEESADLEDPALRIEGDLVPK